MLTMLPVANVGGPYSGTVDQVVSFDGSGSSDPDSDPLTYSWDFGDGNSGTGVSPSHTYATGGTFTVILTVDDGNGDTGSDTTTAVIANANNPPVANVGGPYSGTVDQVVSFNGSGSSDPDSDPLTYSWDFGDGNSGTGVSPSYTYATGGTFTVILTVDDGNGDTGSDTTTAVIANANNAPVAHVGGPYSGTVDQVVSFNGSGSSDPDSDPLTYSWDFGDGNSGTGVSPSHTYATGGTYTVILTVDDGNGDTGSDTTTAVIANANNAPVANVGGPYSGTADQVVSFNGSGSSDPDSDPLTYSWDFGDGNSGTGVSPSHTYATGGTFTVILTVDDGNGDTGSDTTTAVIANANNAPVANVGGPYSGTVDQVVSFDGSGSSDPDSDPLTYSWDFGDGNSGTGVSPSHTYATGGTFTVILTVDDGNGDTGSDTTTAVIANANNAPVANVGGPYSGTADQVVSFNGSGSSDPDSDPLTYSWDFGDGNSGTGVSPSQYLCNWRYFYCCTDRR